MYTKEDIFRITQEQDVKFIRLQFTDLFGVLRNVAVTDSQLEKALNNRVTIDGAALSGMEGPGMLELILKPDLETMAIFPWRPQQGKVMRFLCDVCYPDGTPFEGDARQILRRVLSDAKKEGYQFLVSPECEFFLYHLDDCGFPTTITHERAGYLDVAPMDLGEDARRDMILAMEEMCYEVKSSFHQFAPAQHEIDLGYSKALKAADAVTTFRLAARTVAKRHGLYATFMPKPRDGVHGSGMHINLSMHRNGLNVFENPDGGNGLSREACWFIGGLMRRMREISAITNPLVNSYKRLNTGYEAPQYIAWSRTDRSSMIRVPEDRGFYTRLELRSPDSAANPYLTLALFIAAGLEGIRDRIEPPTDAVDKDCLSDPSWRRDHRVESLPSDLGDALEAFGESELAKKVLGEPICRWYLKAKMSEWNEYALQVSQWELDKYLSNY